MNKHQFRNIIGGVVLLVLAAVLVLYKLDMLAINILPDITLWQIIIGICLVYCLIHSIFFHKSITGTLFGLAFLGIVFSHQLHIEKLVPWTILLVAFLASIALNLIFGTHKKWYNNNINNNGYNHNNYHHHEGMETETIEGECIFEAVSFTGATKYIRSDNFKSADIQCSFCGAEFYFDKVNVPSKEVTITLDSKFCGVTLFVPRDWEVICDVNSFLGAVDVDNRNIEPANIKLVLRGNNSFAGVEVKRV